MLIVTRSDLILGFIFCCIFDSGLRKEPSEHDMIEMILLDPYFGEWERVFMTMFSF